MKTINNWFYSFLVKFGIMEYMEQDQAKVNAIAKKLKEDTGDEWSEVEGFFVMPASTFEGTTPNVNLNKVMVHKAFLNPKTGEIKYYWIKIIIK